MGWMLLVVGAWLGCGCGSDRGDGGPDDATDAGATDASVARDAGACVAEDDLALCTAAGLTCHGRSQQGGNDDYHDHDVRRCL